MYNSYIPDLASTMTHTIVRAEASGNADANKMTYLHEANMLIAILVIKLDMM